MIRRGAGLFGTLAVALVLSAWGCGDDETKSSSTGNGGQGATGGGGTTTTTTTTTTTSTGGMGGSGGMVVTLEGDCIMPGVLGLGDTINGDTSNGADNLSGSCQNGTDNEIVYSFAASATGTLTVSITSDADLGIYVHTVCDDTDSVIACADADLGPAFTETVTFAVTSGETYFIIVDGYDVGEAGPFTLTMPASIAEEGSCSDGTDGNANGLVDCEDSACLTDATCTTAFTAACAAATPLTPNVAQNGDTAGGTTLFAGSCTGFDLAPERLYSYLPAAQQVMFTTLASATDQGVYVRTACADPTTQTACADDNAGGTDEIIGHQLVAGAAPLTLLVDGFGSGNEGPYTLTVETANTTETEPNDSTAAANTFVLGHVGYTTFTDNDYIAITLAVAGDLTVSTTDVFAGDCAGTRIDTEIELLDTNGTTQLQFNDDIDEQNNNYCSEVTATALPAGTYYVRVSASQMFCSGQQFSWCTAGYTLSITIN
jgi:hypothetical protein